MGQDESEDGRKNVLRGLESSGLLLELQVQDAFGRAKADVSHVRSYTDSKSGDLRETDVVASFTGGSDTAAGFVHVVYVVECKRGQGANGCSRSVPKA